TLAQGLSLYLAARGEAGPNKEAKTPEGGGKRADAVAKAVISADKPGADGKQVGTGTFTIDKGWHLDANPVPEDFPGIPVTVTVGGKAKPEAVKVDYPKGKLVKDKMLGDYRVYEDKAVITAHVRRAKGDTGPLEVSVKFQACTEKQCLLEATVK